MFSGGLPIIGWIFFVMKGIPVFNLLFENIWLF